MPTIKEGELITEYIKRCFILKPRFSKDEIINSGNDKVAWYDGANGYEVNAITFDGTPIAFYGHTICAFGEKDFDGFIKRVEDNALSNVIEDMNDYINTYEADDDARGFMNDILARLQKIEEENENE